MLSGHNEKSYLNLIILFKKNDIFPVLLNKHMKAFFFKKIKHIAHKGFCRKK